jgi:hypothetical protein
MFSSKQSAVRPSSRSRPRREDYGEPSRYLARVGSDIADDRHVREYDDHADADRPGRGYARPLDESVEMRSSGWTDEESVEMDTRDPWNRDWANWSSTDDDDDRYYEDDLYDESGEWEAQRQQGRAGWGGWPDEGTMASVAVNIPSRGGASRGRSYSSTRDRRKSAKPSLFGSYGQILVWIGSGFSHRAMPTRRAINTLLLTCILGAIFLSGAGLGLVGYNDYSSLTKLVKAGEASLSQMAEDLGIGKSKHTTDTAKARADLLQAEYDFQTIHDRLASPDFVLSIADHVPIIDKKLQSALILSNIGVEAMQMMVKIFPAIYSLSKMVATSPISAPGDTTDTNAPILAVSDLSYIRQGFIDAQPYIADMVNVLNSTPIDTLTAVLTAKQKSEIVPFLKFIPQIPLAEGIISDFLTIAPTVLGINEPVAYLLTTLDNGEIRPVGGFQGQVAIFSVNGGHFSHISLQDVYQLENKDQSYAVPYPSEGWWGDTQLGYNIRNSGLSPDFPTSAQYTLNELHSQPLCKVPLALLANAHTDPFGCPLVIGDYPEGNHVPIIDQKTGKITGYDPHPAKMAGMIAIQTPVIQQLLQLVGPIQVGCPYKVTVKPDNLEHYIHFFQETYQGQQLGKQSCGGGGSDSSKRFTSILAKTLLDKIKTISKTSLISFVGTLLNDLKTRDLQVYFANPDNPSFGPYGDGEKFLKKYGATSAVYAGPDDSLLVNQANFAGDKLNLYMQMHLVDHITLQGTQATHHLEMDYQYSIPPIKVNPADAFFDPNFKMQVQAYQAEVFNLIFNAAYGSDYAEYRRVYVPQDAVFQGGTGLLDGTGAFAGAATTSLLSTTSDITGRAVFGSKYDYRFALDPSGTSVNWFAPDGIPNPTMNWNVPDAVKGSTYTLMLERQSGVPTSADVTITCAATNKVLQHVSQSITTETPITVSNVHC